MSQTHHTADYEQALSDAEECLGDIEELEWKFPIGAMIDYASKNSLSVAVIERLERIQRAAAVLCNDGPDAIWGFANDAGLTRWSHGNSRGRASTAIFRKTPTAWFIGCCTRQHGDRRSRHLS
jgi:hypothetical protein